MSFVYKIENNNNSYQASPAYVLTFARFSNRDTTNYTEDHLKIREPLVVVNDAISVNVQTTKSNPTPTFSCVLKQGDINYLTAISPGDYVTVNMVHWESKAIEIMNRALEEKPINRHDDGFKGLFKVMDVNMTLSTNESGKKQYYVQITARGFDEFNNILYFNPALIQTYGNDESGMLFTNQFNNFTDLVQKLDTSNVQFVTKSIIERTIGKGFSLQGSVALDKVSTYSIPSQIASLINQKDAKYISGINKYYIGIWDATGSGFGFGKSFSGFHNFFKDTSGSGFFETSKDIQGSVKVAFQDFQSVSVWSLLNNYSNPQINESYTCYRIAPDNHIYPSLVIRQKPFTTRHYKEKNKNNLSDYTEFLSLPAWKIDSSLIYNINIGRSDKGRVNFVQVFSRAMTIDRFFDPAVQITSGNFVEDKKDVERHGRKPYVVTCNYAPPESEKVNAKAKEWAYLIADWLFEGHLKLNGTMEVVGIEEPICVGDNLEFDDVIYHIESISHSINITPEGFKSFKTQLSLSMGVDKRSNSSIPVYGEMDNTDSYKKRLNDFNKEKVLPGFSDTQDIPSRENGEEVVETKEQSFTNSSGFLSIKK